jgi:hypothetical protein
LKAVDAEGKSYTVHFGERGVFLLADDALGPVLSAASEALEGDARATDDE